MLIMHYIQDKTSRPIDISGIILIILDYNFHTYYNEVKPHQLASFTFVALLSIPLTL